MNSPVRRVKGTRWSWFGSTVWHGHCHIFWIPRNKQGNHPVGPACPRWSYAGRRDTDDRPTVIVAAVKGADPDITLQAMRERTPRGRSRWQPSSVRILLERSEKLRLLENGNATGNQRKGLTIRNRSSTKKVSRMFSISGISDLEIFLVKTRFKRLDKPVRLTPHTGPGQGWILRVAISWQTLGLLGF